MTTRLRALPSLTPMHRGQLPACSCRHARVDGLHRQSGRIASRIAVGSVGDAYDNALAESTIGLYKAEKIDREGPWKTLSDVELAIWSG